MFSKKKCMSVINLHATVDRERHVGGRRHPTPDPIPKWIELDMVQRTAKGAGEKGPRQEASKIVKKCQDKFQQSLTTHTPLIKGVEVHPLN